ncbi:hypothetical protein RND71_014432 [Anisodus tanguticus]|uniref:Uncharacterized protein n=1 Tax=Anisodus tanguticus TaxID=243964 RepID=A0AAE1SBA2_9SOLA|nr:hypothetical protein RND71_014432 [Anisodus tanguticus]
MAGRNGGRGANGGRGGNVVPPLLEVENEGENVFADLLQEVEYPSTIILQKAGVNFKSHSLLYQLLNLEGYFRNSTDDDPHQHLRNISGVGKLLQSEAGKVVELDPTELEEEAPLDVSSSIDEVHIPDLIIVKVDDISRKSKAPEVIIEKGKGKTSHNHLYLLNTSSISKFLNFYSICKSDRAIRTINTSNFPCRESESCVTKFFTSGNHRFRVLNQARKSPHSLPKRYKQSVNLYNKVRNKQGVAGTRRHMARACQS